MLNKLKFRANLLKLKIQQFLTSEKLMYFMDKIAKAINNIVQKKNGKDR